MSEIATSLGLPASRTDALSLVVLGLGSALIGDTPRKGKRIALVLTIAGNLWALVSSLLTLRDALHASEEFEKHLWFFLLSLLVLTIFSSALSLVGFVVEAFCDTSNNALFRLMLGGLAVVATMFLFGILELRKLYTRGCDDILFQGAALCAHTSGHAFAAFLVALFVGLFGSLGVMFLSVAGSRGVAHNAWAALRDADYKDEHEPYSVFGMLYSRTSAFAKACLIGFYWFLVNGDLRWDWTVNGHETSYWVTGQWAKQGVAIANNALNHLSC